MTQALIQVGQWFNPLRWVGPIFDKELRVASRRRRNYVLRSVYLIGMLVFITVVWCNLNLTASSPSMMGQRLAEAGVQVITMIVTFQFVAMQLLAIAMLSTAISDEITHQTLGVLMTTPITSGQIVMGKLMSRAFQLIVIALITVPILAILRVFGGVPWQFILASFCVTVTTVLFTGALSLLFSIQSRQAHGVILRTVSMLILFYGALPMIVSLLVRYYLTKVLGHSVTETVVMQIGHWLTLISPWAQMSFLVSGVMHPGVMNQFSFVTHWGIHCAVMLALTLGILGISMRMVRRVALSQAAGQLIHDRKGRWFLSRKPKQETLRLDAIRPVRGACVVWKELRTPLIQGGKTVTLIGFGIAVASQVGLYVYYGRAGLLKEEFTHTICISLFFMIGLLGSIFQSATTITSEKETRSWPILLSTPLTDWQILLGKVVGTVRRCLPVWIFLAIHMVLFTVLGYMHWMALPLMALIVVWVVTFLTGTGLYFSMRCQKTSAAVIGNLGLILFVWLAVPAVVGVLSLFGRYYGLMNLVSFANPLVQTIAAMTSLAGQGSAHRPWHDIQFYQMRGATSSGVFLTAMQLYAATYMALGIMFLGMAKRRLRKRIFV